MEKQIKEDQENDTILSQVLAEEIKQARSKKSLKSICYELGIEVIE